MGLEETLQFGCKTLSFRKGSQEVTDRVHGKEPLSVILVIKSQVYVSTLQNGIFREYVKNHCSGKQPLYLENIGGTQS